MCAGILVPDTIVMQYQKPYSLFASDADGYVTKVDLGLQKKA